jgi:hypothetical protein
MHIERLMEYGYNLANLLSFIRWWITSDRFGKDRQKGEGGDRRGRTHTIAIHYREPHDLRLEKGVIFSDEPRELKENEFSIQNDLDKVTGKIEKWLREKAAMQPHNVSITRFREAKRIYGIADIGFFAQSVGITNWGLLIHADVVGVPK